MFFEEFEWVGVFGGLALTVTRLFLELFVFELDPCRLDWPSSGAKGSL